MNPSSAIAAGCSFYLTTLGCKVNQYESQALREAWLAQGMTEAGEPASAQCIIINSCAVTAKAVADVRHAVRRLHREAPAAHIIVTGCAAVPEMRTLSALPGVLRVIGQEHKADLAVLLPALARSDAAPVSGAPLATAETAYSPLAVKGYDRSRAVLKIQDGCSHGCTYCIVPLTRGRARSRPFVPAMAEVGRFLDGGFREIVISGVNLRQYRDPALPSGVHRAPPPGVDSESRDALQGDFWDFLLALDAAFATEWAGRARFRLSSLEPGQLGSKALDTLRRCRMVAPHLHLSLQSGSAAVLRRMGRGHYEPVLLPEFLEALRAIWPVYGLGADILTAFPGESEEEFAEGLALVRRLPLTYAHVFPYSKRPGTRAALMPGQIGADVKKRRAAVLRETVNSKKLAFLDTVAQLPIVRAVFESTPAPGARGVSEYYTECRFQGDAGNQGARSQIPGALTAVRPVGVGKGMLLVEPL